MKSYYFTEIRARFRHAVTKWFRPAVQFALVFFVGFGTVILWMRPEGQRLDLFVLRYFFEHRGPRPPPEGVVIVAIDDQTYERLAVSPKFPVPRRFIADALEELVKASPRAVIFDAAFPAEPTVDPAADNRIEEGLRTLPSSIWDGKTPEDELDSTGSVTISSDERFRKAAKMEVSMAVFSTDEVVLNLTDHRAQEGNLFQEISVARPLAELGNFKLETPPPYSVINFYGPPGTIPRLSISELMSDEKDHARAALTGKVVLVGYQSLRHARGNSEKDEFSVPASNLPMYGLEIHANIVGNLIDRSWLSPPTMAAARLTLLCASLLVASLGIFLTPGKSAPIISLVSVLAVLGSYWEFAHKNYWQPGIGAFLVMCIFSVFISAFYFVVRTESFRRYIRSTFKFDMERRI